MTQLQTKQIVLPPSRSRLRVGPIRQALFSQLRRRSIHDMAALWSDITERNLSSCQRSIERILYRNTYALVDHVDELCLYVLGIHPLLLYELDEWGDSKR